MTAVVAPSTVLPLASTRVLSEPNVLIESVSDVREVGVAMVRDPRSLLEFEFFAAISRLGLRYISEESGPNRADTSTEAVPLSGVLCSSSIRGAATSSLGLLDVEEWFRDSIDGVEPCNVEGSTSMCGHWPYGTAL